MEIVVFTKGKAKVFLFIISVCSLNFVLESSIQISDVARYVIERSYNDVFSVKFRPECTQERCNPTDMREWCKNLSAGQHSSKLSCSCNSPFKTFVPEIGECANNTKVIQTLPKKGCSRFFAWTEMFLKPFNLKKNGSRTQYIDGNPQIESCVVNLGSTAYYDGLRKKWQGNFSEIFTARFDKSNGVKIVLKWKADTKRELSGRIIRLRVTCYYSDTTNKEPRTGCLLLKAEGSVSYNYTSTSTSIVQKSATSSFLLATESPQLLLSSSRTTKPVISTTTTTKKVSVTSVLNVLPSSPLSSPSPTTTSAAAVTVMTTIGQGSVVLSPNVSSSLPLVSSSSSSSSFVQSSSASVAASNPPTIHGPGDKEARTSGNKDGVVIGAAVGGAVVFGIFVIIIIVFCKRRKLWKSKEKATKLEVKNPVYGKSQNDIQMGRTRGNKGTFTSDQDKQPTYQGLITERVNGEAVYSSPENNYDNHSVYQSLDKNVPAGTPVYHSLKKGQPSSGEPTTIPKPSTARQPSEKPSVSPDPVYNALQQPHAGQGNVSEALYNVLEGPDPGSDVPGNVQDPLYNVLEGSDAGQTYEAPDVGVVQDPVYNVLDGPESKQDHQEPLYNVLETADAENSPPQSQGPYDGASNEPLYNVLEGADSDGHNKSGSDYAAPNRPLSAGAHDNPAYEQTLEFDVPYASVHNPGSQRESVYEPLKGSERHDLYEPLNKRGK